MSILFEPGTIKTLVIRNRLVRSATFEGMANFEGRPLPELGRLYYRLAESDVGLIITSAAFVDRYKTLPDVSGLAYPTAMDDDSYIENWRPIVEGVHERGAGIAMQIVHPGRLDMPALRGGPAMAPSAVPDKSEQIAPRAMTQEEIADMVQKFAQACRRVHEAGFDAVQLHGGHGYLISNFISPYVNVRKDEYGGTTENRSRFVLEIVAAARKFVGPDYPIMIKMNGEDYAPGGLDLEESVRVASLICRGGIDCIEVTGGTRPESDKYPSAKGINRPEKEAYFKAHAAALKKSVDVPIILVGGLRSPSVMEKALAEGIADFVSLCRPLIREPALVSRWKKGDLFRAICISCNQCGDNVFVRPLRCYVEEKLKEKAGEKTQ
jgi:2,4-dienoyl-CoA reductase-like NADH-dependent reductase (Old Yellow Enzyme family)